MGIASNLGLCLECGHSIPESRRSMFCELCDADRALESARGKRRAVGEGRDPQRDRKRRAALLAMARCSECAREIASTRSYTL